MGGPNEVVKLSGEEKALVVERKATRPFIGAAVAQNQLPVRNDAKNPLAKRAARSAWRW